MKKLCSYVFILLSVFFPFTLGATISGTVYDLSLDVVDSAIVEINTIPHQQMVTNGGYYEFTVPSGDYILTARNFDNFISENITIEMEGDYHIDLFLYVEFDDTLFDDDIYFEEEDNNSDTIEDPKEINVSFLLMIFLSMLLFFLSSFVVIVRSLRKKEQKGNTAYDEPLHEIVALLRKNQGRMSQRDLRKNLSYSEAKVSLLIAQLEAEGNIKKIKKGRSNILILLK